MHYYYHGVGDNFLYSIVTMIKIINDGYIKTRNDEAMKHICLYKKNEDYDYTGKLAFLNSARGGWIDNCAGFIIKPDIEAYKTSQTNLVDEWRYDNNIMLDMISGIFLPIDEIKKIMQNGNDKYFEKNDLPVPFKNMNFYELLKYLIEFAKERNWLIIDSNEANFTDKLDDTLEKEKLFNA